MGFILTGYTGNTLERRWELGVKDRRNFYTECWVERRRKTEEAEPRCGGGKDQHTGGDYAASRNTKEQK